MKTVKLLSLLLISCSLLFLGCDNDEHEENDDIPVASAHNNHTFDLGSAKTAIEVANTKFEQALSNGDSAALASMYTSDAKMMGNGMEAVVGREKIQSAIDGMIRSGVASVKLTTTDVWGCEDMVAEEGTLVINGKGGKQLDKGKYIVLWKMEDGQWKLFRDVFNSDIPGH